MTDSSGIFDIGLQPERTALAWRRTLLSLAVAVLAASRLLLDLLGLWAYAIAAVGLAFVGMLAIITERRYRATHQHLTAVDRESLPHDGVLIAGVASAAALVGVAALAFVLGRML